MPCGVSRARLQDDCFELRASGGAEASSRCRPTTQWVGAYTATCHSAAQPRGLSYLPKVPMGGRGTSHAASHLSAASTGSQTSHDPIPSPPSCALLVPVTPRLACSPRHSIAGRLIRRSMLPLPLLVPVSQRTARRPQRALSAERQPVGDLVTTDHHLAGGAQHETASRTSPHPHPHPTSHPLRPSSSSLACLRPFLMAAVYCHASPCRRLFSVYPSA